MSRATRAKWLELFTVNAAAARERARGFRFKAKQARPLVDGKPTIYRAFLGVSESGYTRRAELEEQIAVEFEAERDRLIAGGALEPEPGEAP